MDIKRRLFIKNESCKIVGGLPWLAFNNAVEFLSGNNDCSAPGTCRHSKGQEKNQIKQN